MWKKTHVIQENFTSIQLSEILLFCFSMNPKLLFLCYVARSFQLKISWKICRKVSFCSNSHEHKEIKKRKENNLNMQRLKLLVLCERENYEEIFTSHFCHHVHPIEKPRSQKSISQKEVKLLNLMSNYDLYSHTLTIFVQCIKRCINLLHSSKYK